MILSRYFKNFFNNSQSSGILLILCLIMSLIIANSSLSKDFQEVLNVNIGPYSLYSWVNDGLMAIFFLMIGLEIKREILEGELSNFRNASLPILAAIGGILLPAAIYGLFNNNTQYAKGWGIPMATDIAFSLAILSLLGKGIPASIKIFLAALAIVDDLGAILVIAIFYTDTLHWEYMMYSGGCILLLTAFNYFRIINIFLYLIVGVFLWNFMHHTGIHATISGVFLAFTIPTKTSTTKISPLEKLESILYKPVGFFIMPIFALINTNITFSSGMLNGLYSDLGLGIIFGLVIGKLLGINLLSFLSIKLKISKLPDRSNWKHMIGTGFLAGIGFTMSIFISLLSFKEEQQIQDEAKFSILIASVISGILGFLVLRSTKKKRNKKINSK